MAEGYPDLHVYPSRIFTPMHYSGVPAPGTATPRASTALGQHRGLRDTVPASASSAGKWNYADVVDRTSYGDSTSYQKGAEFLKGLAVEDWGCGMGWMRNFVDGPYVGIDGSKSKFSDKVEDLTKYTSKTEGLFIRHVLEHDWRWEEILHNALSSFTKRMVLVFFTPYADKTQLLCSVGAFGDRVRARSHFPGASSSRTSSRKR